MSIDTTVLLVVSALVVAASLLSYVASQWAHVTHNHRVFGWITLGIGTAMLLAAAVLVLTVAWKFALRSRADGNASPPVPPSALGSISLPRTSNRTPDRTGTLEPAGPLDDSQAQPQQRISRRTERTAPSASRSHPIDAGTHASPRSPLDIESSQRIGTHSSLNPWLATQCVRAFLRDPLDPTRWTIENNCAAAVAIVIASCDAPQCRRGDWKYDAAPMLLPAKHQRATTQAEETRVDNELHWVACTVTRRLTSRLIGVDREFWASDRWRERFERVRDEDECLVQAQALSNVGQQSRDFLEALAGAHSRSTIRHD